MPVYGNEKFHLLQKRLFLSAENEAEGGLFDNGRKSFTSFLKKLIVSLREVWFWFSIAIHTGILPDRGASCWQAEMGTEICGDRRLLLASFPCKSEHTWHWTLSQCWWLTWPPTESMVNPYMYAWSRVVPLFQTGLKRCLFRSYV